MRLLEDHLREIDVPLRIADAEPGESAERAAADCPPEVSELPLAEKRAVLWAMRLHEASFPDMLHAGRDRALLWQGARRGVAVAAEMLGLGHGLPERLQAESQRVYDLDRTLTAREEAAAEQQAANAAERAALAEWALLLEKLATDLDGRDDAGVPLPDPDAIPALQGRLNQPGPSSVGALVAIVLGVLALVAVYWLRF